MKTKHTPAPWKRSEDNKTVFAYSEKEPVAWVSGYSNDAEQEANAKLIAASPELLDASQSVLATLNAMVQNDMIRGMIMVLEIAINKATL